MQKPNSTNPLPPFSETSFGADHNYIIDQQHSSDENNNLQETSTTTISNNNNNNMRSRSSSSSRSTARPFVSTSSSSSLPPLPSSSLPLPSSSSDHQTLEKNNFHSSSVSVVKNNIPNNLIIFDIDQDENSIVLYGNLPERIEGGVTKCPICTKNKQTCEEGKILMEKINVSNPFIRTLNEKFNKKVNDNRGKIKVREFNGQVRDQFKELMTILSERETPFNSEEEYLEFIEKEYYDKLNGLLKKAINGDDYEMSDEDSSDFDSSSESEYISERSDLPSSDEEYQVKPKRKKKQSNSSKKRSRGVPPLNDVVDVTKSSSAQQSEPLNKSEDIIYILAQEENDCNGMFKACFLNLTDFESADKFKSKIKKELEYTTEEFKVYFKNKKLGKSFLVANKAALECLKQQAISHEPNMEIVSVKKL